MSHADALIPVGTLLVGTLLGWLLERSSARQNRAWALEDDRLRLERDQQHQFRTWQREERSKAYYAFAAASDRYLHLLALTDGNKHTGEEYLARQRPQLIDLLAEIQLAEGSMMVIAPEPVAELAFEFHMRATQALGILERPELLATTTDGRALGRWLGIWKSAAKADLEGHPFDRVPPDVKQDMITPGILDVLREDLDEPKSAP